ncbi:MAG: YqaJ viral recombinase family protein [Candidatus Paceibacterota bacterium]
MLNELSPLRIGCVSASRIADMMAKGKGVSRAKYSAQLAAERLSGRPHRANFTGAAMDHGNEYEDMAGTKYAFRNMVTLTGTGKDWIPHPFIEFAGCSPDRFVDDDGLLEIKNPETHTLFRYFETVEIPQDYKWQMTWQLACTRRKWCDWVAHDPDLPDEDGYLEVRFEPSSKDIADLEREVRFFNAEVDHLIQLAIKRRTL